MSEREIGACPSCQEQDSYVHDGSRICGACGFDAPVDDFGGVFGWNRLSGFAAEVARLRTALEAIRDYGEYDKPIGRGMSDYERLAGTWAQAVAALEAPDAD